MNDKLKSDELDSLFNGIMSLDSLEDCYDFFEDLCTYPELKALSQRFEVASLLLKHMVYTEIVERTGASTATISRVKRALDHGNDGYKRVIDAMNEKSGR